MKLIIIILCILFFSTQFFPQELPLCSCGFVDSSYSPPAAKVSSVNLSGHFEELVVTVGFSDFSPSYPTIDTNYAYPLLGVFPDGTLLSDYIIQNGSPIPIDEWYEPAFDTYFDTHSGGEYTVDFEFIKTPTGNTYTPDSSFTYFQDGGSINNVIWNNWYEICHQVTSNMYSDNPQVFNNIDLINFVFKVGSTPKDAFSTLHGGTVRYHVTFNGPGGAYYDDKPITLN